MWIYGASGHGKVILDCLETLGQKVTGFIDDDPSKQIFMGFPVVTLDKFDEKCSIIVIAIGDNHLRKAVVNKLKVEYITVIHPSSFVSRHCNIGKGSVVVAHATVNSGTKIGEHCILNTNSSVDHDCKLGDFVHIAPGATICGNVTIGSLTWIGAGAVVRENICIGENAMIGAGSVIVKDVPDNALILGVPGKITKYMAP